MPSVINAMQVHKMPCVETTMFPQNGSVKYKKGSSWRELIINGQIHRTYDKQKVPCNKVRVNRSLLMC